MSFLIRQIAKPLVDHTSPSFLVQNFFNKDHVSAASNLSKRWAASYFEVETVQAFDEKVTAGSRPVLALFYKPECRFCHLLDEKMAHVLKSATHVDYVRVNVERARSLAEKYEVEAVPTLLSFRGGKQVDTIVGNVHREEIERTLDKLK